MDNSKENTNSISVLNSGNQSITIIVEYIHYVEELEPNQEFKIVVKAGPSIDLGSLFVIEYGDKMITIRMNNRIEEAGNYDTRFFVDDRCVYEQVL